MLINLPEKPHYTIGEVANAFGVNTSLIRFWEGEFDNLKIKKDKRGNRQFFPKDIEQLELIHSLVKVQGFTLEGAKEYLRNKLHKIEYKLEVIKRLESIKEELLQIKSEL